MCPHGNLELASKGKKRVSSVTWRALAKLFPSAVPFRCGDPPCDACAAHARADSEEAKAKWKARLQEKKSFENLIQWVSEISRMDQKPMPISHDLPFGESFILFPFPWLLEWITYLNDVDESPPPPVPTNFMICRRHGYSLFDPMVEDEFYRSVHFVPKVDAKKLMEMHGSNESFVEISTFTTSHSFSLTLSLSLFLSFRFLNPSPFSFYLSTQIFGRWKATRSFVPTARVTLGGNSLNNR